MRCHGCKHRYPGCHGWCEVSIEYHTALDAEKKRYEPGKEADSFLINGSLARKNRFRSGIGRGIKIGVRR